MELDQEENQLTWDGMAHLRPLTTTLTFAPQHGREGRQQADVSSHTQGVQYGEGELRIPGEEENDSQGERLRVTAIPELQ